jgi:2-oxoglutarate ferredoxin oxidoreductase subunit beta
LRKLAKDWDPFNRFSALNKLNEARARGEILTGLIYIDEESKEFHEIIKTVQEPLNQLTEKELSPGSDMLNKINEAHR